MLKFATTPTLDKRGNAREKRILAHEGFDGRFTVAAQDKPMAKRYITTDPFKIADALGAVGWTTSVETPRGQKLMGSTRWDALVRFWRNDEYHPIGKTRDDDSPYQYGGIWHCNHSGRKRFAGVSGLTRLFCLNQFPGAKSDGEFSWTHTDERLREVLANITSYSARLARGGKETFERIDVLAQGHRHRRRADYFLNAIALHKPRLAASVATAFREYRPQGPQQWALVQALTQVRSPVTAALAQTSLHEGFDAFKHGAVPETWSAILN